MSSAGPLDSLKAFFKDFLTSTPEVAHLNEQLVEAVRQQDLPSVETCLQKGAQVAGLMINQQSLLVYTILNDSLAKKPKGGQFSAPFRASQTRDLSLIRMLIDAGAKVDDTWRFDLSILHFAVNAGWSALVKLLVEAGAKVDVADCGHTPLWTAASLGYNDIIEILVGGKADLNKPGRLHLSGHLCDQEPLFTPAEIALANGHADTVSLLCKLGSKAPEPPTLHPDIYSPSAAMVYSRTRTRKSSEPIAIPSKPASSYFSKP